VNYYFIINAWAPAGMGRCLPPSLHPRNVKMLFVLQMLSRVSAAMYALFCENVSTPRSPLGFYPWTMMGDLCHLDPSMLTSRKNPVGAHVIAINITIEYVQCRNSSKLESQVLV